MWCTCKLDCFHVLAITNTAVDTELSNISKTKVSVLLDIYSEVGFIGHMLIFHFDVYSSINCTQQIIRQKERGSLEGMGWSLGGIWRESNISQRQKQKNQLYL